MMKAYDTLFEEEILANKLNDSHTLTLENDRFLCPVCGERTRYVNGKKTNKDGRKRSSYFKHENENNKKECENYHGKIMNEEKIQKIKKDKENVYFNVTDCKFEIGFKMSSEDLERYHNENAKIIIISNSKKEYEQYIEISKSVFAPNELEFFQFNFYAENYTILEEGKDKRSHFKIFEREAVPTFFKVLSEDHHLPKRAKKVYSKELMTKTKYFVTATEEYKIKNNLLIREGITLIENYTITFSEKKLYGAMIIINKVNQSLRDLLKIWGYHLKELEKLCVLWPPMYQSKEMKTTSNEVYIKSDFDIIPHENINKMESVIEKSKSEYIKISNKDKLKILVNSELLEIQKIENVHREIISNDPEISYERVFKKKDSLTYHKVSDFEIKKIPQDDTIYLTQGTSIVYYKNNYVEKQVLFKEFEKKSVEQIFKEVINYTKRTERYIINNQLESKNPVVNSYLEKCKISGEINAAVKQLILEGKL